MAIKAKFQKLFLSHFNHFDVVSFQNSFPVRNSEFRNNFKKSFWLKFKKIILWIYMYKVLELILTKSGEC